MLFRRLLKAPDAISFNGAATFPSRMHMKLSGIDPYSYMLQWGRDVSVADAAGPSFQLAQRISLQWGRDVSVADALPRDVPYILRDQLQWGRDVSVADAEMR